MEYDIHALDQDVPGAYGMFAGSELPMAWKNVDWLDVQNQEYQTALNDRVHEVYRAAYGTLEKTFRSRQSWYEGALKESKIEGDAEAANYQLMHAEHRWEEQRQALAAMALSLMAGLNKSFLDDVKRMFDRTHPADANGYRGASQLQRRVAEFNGRFHLNLEAIEEFETVRETELARHSCLHNEGTPTEDYLGTKRRLIEHEKINLTPELLDKFILELATFGSKVTAKMKALR